MNNYTRKTIKLVATLTIISTINLNAFSFFNSETPKECIIKYEGKLNFLTELYNKNMLVTTGEQIRATFKEMNGVSDVKTYIDARSEIMKILINRAKGNNAITHHELGSLIEFYKNKQSECIKKPSNNDSNNLLKGW